MRRTGFAVLLVGLALAAPMESARASCFTSCQMSCRIGSPNILSECVRNCNRNNCERQASYGAIAFGATSGAWGASYDWANQAKAESVAMQNCAQHGNDCKAIVWFKQQCGAVASGEGTAVFWGLGGSDELARADAQNKCMNNGGKSCEVRASQCSK